MVTAVLPRHMAARAGERPARVGGGGRGRRAKPVALPSLAVMAGVTLIAVAASLAYLGQRAEITRLGYHARDLECSLAAVRAEHERLSLEVARLKSLDLVEKVAREVLGMTEPGPGDIKYLTFLPPASPGAARTPADRPSLAARAATLVARRAPDLLLSVMAQFVGRWFAALPGG